MSGFKFLLYPPFSGISMSVRTVRTEKRRGSSAVRFASEGKVKFDLIKYKYKCEDGSEGITLVERDESGLIMREILVACKSDSIFVALLNLKELTKKLPLEERLWLFFRLLDLKNFELSNVAPYTELYQLLMYYLF
jgi:hypothetical protein